MEPLTIPVNYKIPNKEFRYIPSSDGGTYIHRFPVWKYNRTTTLECELAIDELTGAIQFNVMDMNRVPYAPFYYVYCGKYEPMLGKIHDTINAELKRLGIITYDSITV